MANIIPYITGSKDRHFETAGDVEFDHLAIFDSNLAVPQPDAYDGVKPGQIDNEALGSLQEYILPSTSGNLPVAPNFFREDKSASGRADVAQNLALHDGAVGARGMFYIQNYGKLDREYDNNAYTISCTYHPGEGYLKLYATHPRAPARITGEPQYYMTQLRTFAMTGSMNSFRSGIAAYRNAREWTRQQRDNIIASANDVARRHRRRSFG